MPTDGDADADSRVAAAACTAIALGAIAKAILAPSPQAQPPVTSEAKPWLVWLREPSGGVWTGACSDGDLKRIVGDTTLGEPGCSIVAMARHRDVPDVMAAWQTIAGGRKDAQRRRLRTPWFVPRKSALPTGVAGDIAGPFAHDGRPVVLATWRLEESKGHESDFADLASVLHARITADSDEIRDAGYARMLLERPVESAHIAEDDEIAWGRALLGWERFVERLEDRFYAGQDLTHDDIADIEHVMRELVTHAAKFPTPEQRTEVVGYKHRLARLRDAQATKDAQGPLTVVLGAVTALVLVPTLVAGVYGANVEVPLNESPEGWRSMLALMMSGAIMVLYFVSGVSASVATRALTFDPPGQPDGRPKDPGWDAALLFVAFAGAAGAAVLVAVDDVLNLMDKENLDSVSTLWLLYAAFAVVGLAAAAVCGRDVRKRSCWHGLTDLAAIASGATVAWGVIDGGGAVASGGVGGLLLCGVAARAIRAIGPGGGRSANGSIASRSGAGRRSSQD